VPTVNPVLFFNSYCTAALNNIMNADCQSFFTTFGVQDVNPSDLARMQTDCTGFLAATSTLLNQGVNLDNAGAYFWYTRNHFGSNYFASVWSDAVSAQLTIIAQSYPESKCFMGVDGVIYVAP